MSSLATFYLTCFELSVNHMRYFASISYNGSAYFGWQRQPTQISVQEIVEKAFSTILNRPTEVTGCGRTDSGVHAKNYMLHFDGPKDLPPDFVRRLNKFLPEDIVVHQLMPVRSDAHARFDAFQRSYEYHLIFEKNPFLIDTAYFFPRKKTLNFNLMNLAATQLLNYNAFFPFCKTGHDAKTLVCHLTIAEWQFFPDHQKMIFHITSNRFLRGMVRLIVGMCINVGLGKVTIEELNDAMEQQTRLPQSLSVPPQGLYLTAIKYPSEIFEEEKQSQKKQ